MKAILKLLIRVFISTNEMAITSDGATLFEHNIYVI